ncbi:MAG: hypothetical protein ABI771_13235, partial [Betaproteobacteria bacterium]
LIVNMTRAVTEPSPMMKEEKSRTVVGDSARSDAKPEGARVEAKPESARVEAKPEGEKPAAPAPASA